MACSNVNSYLGPLLLTQELEDTEQEEIDKYLIDVDGSPDKSCVGGNAILAISMAVCKAGAARKGVPVYRHIADIVGVKDVVLPVPMFNMINGGAHAGNKLCMQEYMIMPSGASSFTEAMKMGMETYQHLRNIIKKKYGLSPTFPVDEGALSPPISKDKEALGLLNQAIKAAGYTGRFEYALSASASQFYVPEVGKYNLDFKNPLANPNKFVDATKLSTLYKNLIKGNPIVSIEDPFNWYNWDEWSTMVAETSGVQIVGDELTLSNPKRVRIAAYRKACNCFLLKINQIGTITECIKAHRIAKNNAWGTIVSHRPGDTEDTFIADLAVGLSCGQFKSGAPCRSERLAKYNEILRIEEGLGPKAIYAGRAFRNPLQSFFPE